MHTHQLTAPQGFECLVKDEVYHFVSQHHRLGRVFLVNFSMCEAEVRRNSKGASKRGRTRHRAVLLKLPREVFERGLTDGRIRKVPIPSTMPPWLASLEGRDIDMLDCVRTALVKQRSCNEASAERTEITVSKGFRSHSDRVDEREALIADAFADMIDILSADDPEAELNRYARKCRVPQNETRFRTLFFTKLCFPYSRWALLSPYCRIGRWNRASPDHIKKKFGRPAASLGKHYASPGCDPAFIKKIVDSYLRRVARGVPLTEVYRRVLRLDYSCTTRETEKGFRVVHQPDGEPFPTWHQFRYRIEEAFGRRQLRINVWGPDRVRNKVDPSEGRFSEAVGNLMEKTSEDVARCKEVPRGLLPGSELPPLLKAETVDEASSAIVGIGFTLGSEKNRAYRAARFCEAIGKQKYCSLFGLEIVGDEWPTQGLGPWSQTDRGPGSKGLDDCSSEHGPAIRSMVPSYSPRSNATVESAHTRQVHLEGAPTYLVSNLTPVQMIKGILLEVIAQNHRRDVTEKLTPEMLMEGIPGTPMGIWNFLDERMRTCAHHMPFDQAVRTFLEPVEFKRVGGDVVLHGQRFGSEETYKWLQSSSKTAIKGYVLELCVRYAWIDTGKQILEVEAKLPLRDDESQYYVSMTELKQLGKMRQEARTNGVINGHAVEVDRMEAQQEDTGCSGGNARRMVGRRKPRSKAALEAARDFQTI